VGAVVRGSAERTAVVRAFLVDGMTTKDAAPIEGVAVTAAGLTGRVVSGSASRPLAPSDWEGVRLRARVDCARGDEGLAVSARIVGAYPDPKAGAPAAWLYRVEIVGADGRAAPACDPDGDGEAGALALAGAWDGRGQHTDGPAAFTFACAASAVAKCARWGYSPTSAGELHAACTRMARADYCGDGQPATLPSTPVNVWDRSSRVARGPTREGATFEAAWTPSGALCMNHARWPGRTHVCAARTAPVAGPATTTNELALPVCRSQAEAEGLASPGAALLFNESTLHE
jgi:hypothetical protein